ncbi:putative transferase, chloroplastic, partial [Cucurbita argyrosperma subsp. sororia]
MASYWSYGFSVSDAAIPSTSRAFISNPRPCRLRLPAFRPRNIRKPHTKANRIRTSFSALPFDLSPPPIDEDLLEAATTEGARISDDGIIETFHNDDEALDAANNGVAVVDLSHFGRIRVSGEDRYQFLQNQSTANFESLCQGQGCSTVFVTPTARTIDIAQAWIMKNAITLIVSPVTRESIIQMLNKMRKHKLNTLLHEIQGTHQHFSVNGMPITVGVGNIISEEGMPAPQKELTDEFNVLEAGLWNSISLNKGCYKGQETISRLITYDGVKQRLWGLQLSDSVEPGSPITIDGRKVGKLTSYTPGRKGLEHFGLGYIKKRAASSGDTVIVGENTIGRVVEVPFLARQPPLSNTSSIPNALNVVSNFPFLVIGLIGLVLCYRENYFRLSLKGELYGWTCFYIGVALVAFGSSYYHLEPNDARLVWDRLPMTIAFTSIISIFIIERIDEQKGTLSIVPLLLVGIVSILYWCLFDDLRPYALVQFLPCIAIPLMTILLPPMYTHSTYWLWAAGFYLLAKVEEASDKLIYNWTFHIVSGHTLKHLCAAMVPVFLTLMLAKRTIEPERQSLYKIWKVSWMKVRDNKTKVVRE